MEQLLRFIALAGDDPRLSMGHISLYVTLWYQGQMQCSASGSIYFYRHELAGIAKISSPTTFYKYLQDLHAYGYLRYTPSHTTYLKSMVEFR